MNIETSTGVDVEITVTPTTPATLDRVEYLFTAIDVLASEIATRYPDWRIDCTLGPNTTLTAVPAADLGDDDRE